jgi:hypothetical protein
MDDTKESTKEKSKAVTSRTGESRQNLNPSKNTAAGVLPPTDGKDVTAEAEKMRDLLARMKDLIHAWPVRAQGGGMPAPLIFNDHIIFAFPSAGHVIENAVTSEGKQNFKVDGVHVIPVTSEES